MLQLRKFTILTQHHATKATSYISCQIIIFHQPRFPWNSRGPISLTKSATFWGKSVVWGRYNLTGFNDPCLKSQFSSSPRNSWKDRAMFVPQKRIPLLCNVICLMIYIISCLEPMFSSCHLLADSWPSVDGWNPKQPPGMYKTLQIMGEATYQLVQDFSHQQFDGLKTMIKEVSPKINSSSPGIPVHHWVETLGILAHRNWEW